MTSVSNPPAPPSIRPESVPLAATTNVSLLPALPVRLSKPLNAMAPTVPALGPVNVHVVSAVGPVSVFPVPLAEIADTFENVTPPVPAALTAPPAPLRETVAPELSSVSVLLPAPPSNETATAIVPTVRVSFPVPPVIATDETKDAARVSVVPLRVTAMSEPLVVIAMLFVPFPSAMDHGEAVGLGDALGEALALGDGDGLASDDALGSGDALGGGLALGDVDALGSGDALGDGDGLGAGE